MKVPATVGVPETAPPADKFSPVGNAPLLKVKVYGDVPPLAMRVMLPYALPTVPFVNVPDIVMVGQLMVTV